MDTENLKNEISKLKMIELEYLNYKENLKSENHVNAIEWKASSK